MTKDIIKEIIIVLLLIFAIILVLGVLLYDYVPNNKVLPEEISYSTPQTVKEELKSAEGVDEDTVILTYELDQTDLNNYQRINNYKPGKTNPFSTYETKVEENSEENGETSSNSNSSSGSTKTNTNTSTNNNSSVKKNTNTTKSSTTTPGSVNPGNYTNDKGLK